MMERAPLRRVVREGEHPDARWARVARARSAVWAAAALALEDAA